MRAIQKTKTENNKALYPGAHRSKLGTYGKFRYVYRDLLIVKPAICYMIRAATDKTRRPDVPHTDGE